MKPITVVLVHRQAMVGDALTRMINETEWIDAAAAPDDLAEALRYIKRVQPDVIVVATVLPTTTDATKQQIKTLDANSPRSGIVVLTASDSANVAEAAISAGAAGYVLESEVAAVMPLAIQRVSEGQQWVSPRIKLALAKRGHEEMDLDLTGRQQTIVRSIAWGHTSKEIAVEMNLSRRTIEASRAEILHKLHIESRASIVKYAIDNGLFDEDDAIAVPPRALR
ncbi:MAG: response regulator transcription factor [Actinomycetota bacterium]